MSLFSMLRRPSYSALSLAVLSVRDVGSAPIFHRVISTVPTFSPQLIRRSFVPIHPFSTATATATAVEPISERSLVEVLESEIKCAQDVKPKEAEVPEKFPFQIVDNPGEQTILLKREFEGETIQVCVDIPSVSTGEDDWKCEDPGIPMVVSISKPNGLQLELGVSAFATEILIDCLSVKQPERCSKDLDYAYDGPEFHDLDEELQNAFYKYLEGISRGTSHSHYLPYTELPKLSTLAFLYFALGLPVGTVDD
ncbi:hypothetical protein DVH24_026702 [Malus domestica]|uniref:Mitochondrial glycoprotein family protein n=1 Tax=Malus domestica TaxID=3750 RepID=A0A498K9S6_MALDO|nr:hypothetical protein DVH24_026702 [Malus domestica]